MRKFSKTKTIDGGNYKGEAITIEGIMRSTAFRRGVADVRGNREPRFDTELDGGWFYEWGRQFGVLAPRNMRIVLLRKRQLNPKAIELFRSFKRDII
jgi:hypothetical protein